MFKTLPGGVYPTMITPYTDGVIDEAAVRSLVDWYADQGCSGIFAVCQSSEMVYLSLEERIFLAKTVVEQSAGRMAVVASGHISDSLAEQAREINEIAKTGIDAFVLVSNRLDLHNDGDDVWIQNAEKLLSMIDPNLPLGIYECPHPYKRLLTPKILDWCIATGRFRFIKDTCCDPDMLSDRLRQLSGTGVLLYNANEQTLLHSLREGAAGYSGIMANFHPKLLNWVYDNFETQPEKAEGIFNVLSMLAFTEAMSYPCTAKYYLDLVGVPMTVESRSRDPKQLTNYQKLVVRQMRDLHASLEAETQKGE